MARCDECPSHIEFAREVFMALLSKSQFIEQLAHGKVCRSLGRGLVKTHRLRCH
jgi:hypothetical protein